MAADSFLTAYNEGVKALDDGDNAKAKRCFALAASIMESMAVSGSRELKDSRLARAEKLRDIACSLDGDEDADKISKKSKTGKKSGASGVQNSKDDDDNGFFTMSGPNEKISFDDIIGLASAKEAIHRILIDPLKNPEAYGKYGIKAGGFILLEGPPGTGKTTFAKAAASELDVPFAEVNANSLINSYIGETGKNIDKMFDGARKMSVRSGKPVVLFVDEIDCLAQRRGGESKTSAEAVPTLIKQMDGFSASADNIVIIAATNIKESLDPAIISRFGNVINIPLPTADERKLMLQAKLKMIDKEDAESIDFEKAASLTDGFSGRDITQVTLRLKTALAARDAGISEKFDLNEFLLNAIAEYRKAKIN